MTALGFVLCGQSIVLFIVHILRTQVFGLTADCFRSPCLYIDAHEVLNSRINEFYTVYGHIRYQ